MKKIGILFLAAGTLTLDACTSSVEEEVVEAVETVTYTLDAEKSSIMWKGMENAGAYHTGTIAMKSGSITMEGETLTEGSFVVDMTSIKNTDLPEEKGAYLVGHLTGTIVDENHPVDRFFNVEKFPTVEVKLGEYKDGKLSTTLMILGSELTQEVPVTLASDENGASIKGKFSMDFASVGIPGLAQKEEGSISPMIEFDLNVMLTK